jgi:uncharacterized membrane protein YkoI
MIKRRTVLLLAVLAVILIPGAAAVTHAQQLAPATNLTTTDPSLATTPAITAGDDDVNDDCSGDFNDEVNGDFNDESGDTTEDCTDDGVAIVGSIAVASPAPSDLSALATLTPEAATAAALAANPTATLDEIQLTVKNGYLVYEVEFIKGGEVLIDAGDGKVLLTETADSDINDGSSDPEKDEGSCDNDSVESENEQEDSGD